MMYCCALAARRLQLSLCSTSRSRRNGKVKNIYYSVYKLIKRNIVSGSHSNEAWTSGRIRQTFIQYFKERDHLNVHSSSVIAHKGDGSYFVNAGMNQFKPIFLGTVPPTSDMASYKRAVNSQKCIRIGGKHNDLDAVGKDTYHHTFFEMLGSWSFGDYFKKEACHMAWDLLTRVYGLPERNLYVTYFSGDEKLGLLADEECRHIWLQLGLSKDRVLPGGMQDNFWDMGEMGPCGPCTEIHFDHFGRADARHLVNAASPEVIELWNLVFMQFNRLPDGSLGPLPCHHVDTGMGLERLAAVMQNSLSNYDTDLFKPLFSAIEKGCGCPPYGGKIGDEDRTGVDTAYRVIADHARMLTVAMADGLRPGRKERDNKLRLIIHRCVQQLHRVMKGPPGVVGSLLPVVVDGLGDAFPELEHNANELRQIVDAAEERYLRSIADGRKSLKKALMHYGSPQSLNSDHISLLEDGHFGSHVPLHILTDLAAEFGIHLHSQDETEPSVKDDNTIRTEIDVPIRRLNLKDVEQLKNWRMTPTDDSFKYNSRGNTPLNGRIVALKNKGIFVESVEADTLCEVLLDKTCFYAEGGGQAADVGTIKTGQGSELEVRDVQVSHGYVLHMCQTGTQPIRTGDEVAMQVNSVMREACSRNHTATHIISFALNSVLGSVQQAGSSATADKFTFDFSCLKNEVSSEDIERVSSIVDRLIGDAIPVYKQTTLFSRVRQVRGLSMLTDQVYPSDVRVVSIGVPLKDLLGDPMGDLGISHSVELCGGTHIENTSELGALVVTSVQGTRQGTKRLVAVSGNTAQQAVEMGRQLTDELAVLSKLIKSDKHKEQWLQKAEAIDKRLSGKEVLPKVVRDKVKVALEMLRVQMLSAHKNKSITDQLQVKLIEMLMADQQSSAIVAEIKFNRARDIIEAVRQVQPNRPVFLLSRSEAGHSDIAQGIIYVPQDSTDIFTAVSWAEHVCRGQQAKYGPPKAKKFAKLTNISLITVKFENKSGFEDTLAKATEFVI